MSAGAIVAPVAFLRGFPPYQDPTAPSADFSPIMLAVRSSLQLPDLTRYPDQQWPVVMAPANAAIVPTQLTTFDQWTVDTGFVAGTQKVLAPNYAPVPRGMWGSAVMTPPILSTITGSAPPIVLGTVQVDTNLVAILFTDSTNAYAVAVNLATGASGAALNLGTYNAATAAGIYKESTTSVLVSWRHTGAGGHSFAVCTINASTLAMVKGTTNTIAINVLDTPVQMSAGIYISHVNSSPNDLRSITTGGTTTVTTTAGASGAVSAGVLSNVRLRSSNSVGVNEFAMLFLTAGGGTATTRGVSIVTGTVNAGTGAIAFNTPAAAATNVANGTSGIVSFTSCTDGAWYVACVTNGSPTTTGNFYGIAVSAGAATISAISARANDIPASVDNYGTWIYKSTGVKVERWDGQTAVFGHLATGCYAAQVSAGPTISFGSTLAFAAAKNIVKDASGGGEIMAVSSGLFDKLSIAVLNLASVFQVATTGTATTFKTSELCDVAAKYSGAFYPWTMPTIGAVLRNDVWLTVSGNNLLVVGPVG